MTSELLSRRVGGRGRIRGQRAAARVRWVVPLVPMSASRTAAPAGRAVLASAPGGSIVLMHLGGYETFAALPRVVDGLLDRGFELVTLDEML